MFIKAQDNYKYCELVGIQKLLSTKIWVAVDTGQGMSWFGTIKDTSDTHKAPEYKNEKFYVTTTEKIYEGKEVMTDAKGKYIWKKIETKPAETSTTIKTKTFSSMVEGMNYMGKEGWEFVQAYWTEFGNQNVYRYVLKKKVK